MLLRSRPDTVQRFLLRETQLSTPLIKGSSINKTSEADHHSCYSGFQVQDAANFPACRFFSLFCRPGFRRRSRKGSGQSAAA